MADIGPTITEMRAALARAEAEVERLKTYQNKTALAWTKLTESQEQEIEKLKDTLAIVHTYIKDAAVAGVVVIPPVDLQAGVKDVNAYPSLLQVVSAALYPPPRNT